MIPITIEELEQKLKQWENTTVNLVLEGMIATVIKIENEKVEYTQDEIIIWNKNLSILLKKNKKWSWDV